ncbi:MAG: ABC transporter substrate-binding protein [Spirochaetales bacterium]|nr:ABC transporter substrate-binding protein [Spirochaetales bacterium]
MKSFKSVLIILILFFLPYNIFSVGGQNECETQSTDNIRVVSLAPNITEIIFALGKGDTLVGRTDYCNYPAETADIPSIGSIMEPNIEKIIELEPDLVIASTHAPEKAAELIEKAGIRVNYYYNEGSFEGVYNLITSVAKDVGAESIAEKINADIKKRFAIVKNKAADIQNRPTVYYVVGFGDGGDWTAGGKTFIGQMIKAAGGSNIAEDLDGWSYSIEKIVENDPDIILISSSMKASFSTAPVYSDLSAVKNGKLYAINEDLINRPGPRIIEGAELLNDIFRQ